MGLFQKQQLKCKVDVLHSLNGLEMMSRSKIVHYRAEQEEEYIMTVRSMLKHFERVISQTIMKTLLTILLLIQF